MNIFRIVALFIGLFCGAVASAATSTSTREIAPLAAGGIDSSGMRMSRDGRFLAMLSIPGERGSDCTIIDRRSHKTMTIPGSGRMEPLCFSRDGQGIWVWGLTLDEWVRGFRRRALGHAFIALYDLHRKRYVRVMSGVKDDWAVASGGALSRDGRTLFYCTEDNWICCFNLRTKHLKWRRSGERSDESASVILSSDGSKFFRTGGDEDDVAQDGQIVSTDNWHVLSNLHLPFPPHSGERKTFSGGVFASRGEQIALCNDRTDQWVFLNSRTSKIQWRMKAKADNSDDTLNWEWSPDGRRVAVSGPQGSEVRDARTGKVLAVCPALKSGELTFSANGSSLFELQGNDSGFGEATTLWIWRLQPSLRQDRADARFMKDLRRRQARFALSPHHINESLILAARRGDPRRVKMLLERGAYSETIDRSGDSPLMIAVNGDEEEGTKNHFYKTAKILIEHGANVKRDGGSLLAGAIHTEALLTLLVAHGAQANSRAWLYGAATPLHAAAEFSELTAVKFLLKHGANPNARDKDGQTPLMCLLWWINVNNDSPLEKNTLTTIRELIRHGANVNLRNHDNQNAFQMTTNNVVRALFKKPVQSLK